MKRWLANLVVMVVAAAVPCLLAEAGLRLMAPPADSAGLWRKLPTPVEWSGQPNGRGMHAGVPVAFNDFGYRDVRRAAVPAPGTVRVLALGDSVTYGMGVAQEHTFPRQTEGLLSAARGAPVEVLNLGMPGYNTLHQLALLREMGLALQPKIVVVGFLYNDIELSSAQKEGGVVTQQPAESLPRSIKSQFNAAALWLKQHSLFVAWLSPRLGNVLRPLGVKGLGQVGEVKDQYVDSNPNWRRMQAALLEMKQLTAERGIELVVMIIPAMARFSDATYPIKEYHQAVAGFCRSNGIKVLDLLPAFWGGDGTQYWISATDGHPNAQGQRIIAEALAAYLAPLLPSASMQVTGMKK
ncbi:MAG TPA: SGNH/GDSL hydrolase family protein [Burkholderiales bacterium]|nr:SGNH/GDSL hydrolase family protein [Burkholderiales bacterium]